ncbi:MAG: DUF3859 domain-containing protein [Myxococcota bacterium]
MSFLRLLGLLLVAAVGVACAKPEPVEVEPVAGCFSHQSPNWFSLCIAGDEVRALAHFTKRRTRNVATTCLTAGTVRQTASELTVELGLGDCQNGGAFGDLALVCAVESADLLDCANQEGAAARFARLDTFETRALEHRFEVIERVLAERAVEVIGVGVLSACGAPGTAAPSGAFHSGEACGVDYRTTSIPAEVGMQFGVVYRPIAAPRSVELEIAWTTPELIDPDGEPQTIPSTLVRVPRDQEAVVGYRFHAPWTLVAGDWTVEIRHQGNVLSSTTFRVVRPIPPRANRGSGAGVSVVRGSKASGPKTPALVGGSLAQCLTDSGAVFYGAHWCSACKKQKALFGADVDALPYVECEQWITRIKNRACRGVTAYPTWQFPDGSRQSGVFSLAKLAQRSGCPLP